MMQPIKMKLGVIIQLFLIMVNYYYLYIAMNHDDVN